MAVDLNTFQTTMGWNQAVIIDYTDATALFDKNPFSVPSGNTQVLRVESYDIGVRQDGDAPDYVTGRGDRTAWRKGPIISEGNLNFPFTLPQSGSEASGLSLFICGAELVKAPGSSFSIQSSAHPSLSACKVNTATISCEAENPVTSSATIWGIVDEQELEEIHSYGDQRRYVWGPGTTVETQANPQTGSIYVTFSNHFNANGLPGVADGADVSGQLVTEQIPLFDACSVTGAPEGMFITGFSIEVNNNLQRNYTMGSGDSGTDSDSGPAGRSQYSPFGLNATSISANQRRVSGTITWQSDYQGYISQVLGTGLESMVIRIANIQLTLNQVMFTAEPPTLSTGERMTVQSSFTALGTGQQSGDDAFDALVIESNTELPPGLSL